MCMYTNLKSSSNFALRRDTYKSYRLITLRLVVMITNDNCKKQYLHTIMYL